MILGAFITFGYARVKNQISQLKQQFLSHKPAAD
jgi:hypothetical protein